ncbi:hypothetical protein KL86PLE_60535 [uncultured Pleomorphomonas sp.]|uniref:Uncharacterized protein n=1 Tax=uncultured Pleomorphomonas sp. TaxID=442121 RepID=A0A212LKY7_9HYPH|nr:hypothetical protein KL86PLE_60535 [uncultured Pleomorphomonas sp.]
MVPQAGLEPARSREQQILSLPRLPFRHWGSGGGLYRSAVGRQRSIGERPVSQEVYGPGATFNTAERSGVYSWPIIRQETDHAHATVPCLSVRRLRRRPGDHRRPSSRRPSLGPPRRRSDPCRRRR